VNFDPDTFFTDPGVCIDTSEIGCPGGPWNGVFVATYQTEGFPPTCTWEPGVSLGCTTSDYPYLWDGVCIAGAYPLSTIQVLSSSGVCYWYLQIVVNCYVDGSGYVETLIWAGEKWTGLTPAGHYVRTAGTSLIPTSLDVEEVP
jgi:hypothetical protein